MKQKIRLTERDLHGIIRNCVNDVLNEDFRSSDNLDLYTVVYKYLRKIQNGFHLQNEEYISKIVSELKDIVENNREELSENDDFDSLQKIINNIENIQQDINSLQEDILDLTHGRSVDYYNRYGD